MEHKISQMINARAITTSGGMTLAAICPSVFCQDLGREAGLGKMMTSAEAGAVCGGGEALDGGGHGVSFRSEAGRCGFYPRTAFGSDHCLDGEAVEIGGRVGRIEDLAVKEGLGPREVPSGMSAAAMPRAAAAPRQMSSRLTLSTVR